MLLLKRAVIDHWPGHRPATSEVLQGLFERASVGGNHFTRAERMLATACEFWAAAKNRTLREHLGETAVGQLRAAEESFSAIGLVRIVNILRRGRSDLSADPPVCLRTMAAGIEDM